MPFELLKSLLLLKFFTGDTLERNLINVIFVEKTLFRSLACGNTSGEIKDELQTQLDRKPIS